MLCPKFWRIQDHAPKALPTKHRLDSRRILFPPNAGGSRTTANMLSPQVLARSTAFVGLSGATFGTIFQQRTHQEECCFGSRTPIGGIHKDTANTLYKVMLQCNFVESRIKVLARILCKSCVGRAWTKMVYKYTHTCILHMYIYIYAHVHLHVQHIQHVQHTYTIAYAYNYIQTYASACNVYVSPCASLSHCARIRRNFAQTLLC